MHFKQALVSLVASALTAASAIPVSDQTKVTLGPEIIMAPTSLNVPRALAVQKGCTPGSVLICTDVNWGGTCSYAVKPLNYCENSCDEAQWEFAFPRDATRGLGNSDLWNDQARLSNNLCESRTDSAFQITNFMCE
ncbi:hypothetical protein B0H10DRAFT_1942652 [Mycena sp. CBHHK59/15]|nr:hypothetical protein B0H10DRAFT_1942652 [Mycena sp. CBHHK59/15]